MTVVPFSYRAVLFALALSMTLLFAVSPQAQALDVTYCSRFVQSGEDCYASRTTAHTFNYNRSNASSYRNNNCAFITPSNSSTSGAIYGSGCAPGTRYLFCHSPVQNYYYALVKHFGPGGSTLYGFAQTGKACDGNYGLRARKSRLRAASAASDTQQELADSNAAFRRGADRAPAKVRSLIDTENALDASAGLDASAARRVGRGKPVYVIPGNNIVCATLSVGDVATSGACTDMTHKRSITATTRTPDGFTVWGSVADDVNDITVSFTDGTTKRVPVSGNGFSADFEEEPVSVRAN